MNVTARPRSRVIGGSGLYALLDGAHGASRSTRRTGRRRTRSRWPRSGTGRWRSCPGTAATTASRRTSIPYRANLWALRALGVRQILAPCAVGGLRPELGPGTFVVPDQLDRPYERPRADVLRRRRGARARSPTRTARPAGPRSSRRRGAHGVRHGGRRHHGRRRGPALLDPRRVALVHRHRRRGRQHDRPPGGRPGPRAGPLLHRRSRWSPTWTPASRATTAVTQEEVFRVFGENTARLRGVLLDALAGAARRPRLPLPARPGRHQAADRPAGVTAGRRTTNRQPPSMLSTATSPPCASTRPRTMARPRPPPRPSPSSDDRRGTGGLAAERHVEHPGQVGRRGCRRSVSVTASQPPSPSWPPVDRAPCRPPACTGPRCAAGWPRSAPAPARSPRTVGQPGRRAATSRTAARGRERRGRRRPRRRRRRRAAPRRATAAARRR